MKYMRQAWRGYLPDAVLTKKEGGLGAPIRYWMTHDPLVNERLSPEVVEGRGLFHHAEIDRMRRGTLEERRDYSTLLWGLFTLEVWMCQFADRRPSRLPHRWPARPTDADEAQASRPSCRGRAVVDETP